MSKLLDICEQITKVEKEKETHLDLYRKQVQMMVESGSSNIFFQGECVTCEAFDQQLKSLKEELIKIM